MKKKISLFRKSLLLVRRSAPGWTLANVLISLLLSFIPLALVWYIKRLIDAVTQAAGNPDENATRAVLLMILAVAIIYFLDEAAQSIAGLVRKKQAFHLESFMYRLMHKKAVSLDLHHFENPEYYDRLNRASREAPYRPAAIVNNMVSLLRAGISLILMAGLLATLNWLLVAILLVANIPGIWLRIHYSDILYNFRRELTPVARKATYFHWLLTGDRPSRELRLFGLGNYFEKLFRKNFDRQKVEELSIVRKRSLIELVSALFKGAAVLVTLYYIVMQTISSGIGLGELAMFLLAFRLGMTYIKQILGATAGLYEDSLFINDVFEFLNLRESITVMPPVLSFDKLRSNIRIENVCYRYPSSSSDVLKGINLKVNKGETLALVGANGAGKTTLIRLLCRLYDPQAGKILIDGNNIKNIDPNEYRKLFSVVFQDFMLYNMSAGENIRVGNIFEDADKERINASAESAGIDELINSLPRGYDTVIGRLFDDSRELSWGEWQKIALARALYRQSDILVLDEPASALDARSEYKMFSRFKKLAAGRTCILISHRLANVSIADRIVVIDNGRVIEEGSHNDLLEAKGTYSTLFNQQKSMYS
ncbi:MAG: ABC transporter ATP-binding protein/permease [Bacteroidales bacterium]|nr:ABC transporter ATP-binding protein/permease [Bacteroidales bacterium]